MPFFIRSTDLKNGLWEYYGEHGTWYQDPGKAFLFKRLEDAIRIRNTKEIYDKNGIQRFHLSIEKV